MWLTSLRKRICSRFRVIAFVGLYVSGLAGCGDRETILVIEKPTEVLAIEQAPPASGSMDASVQPGKVIATLKAGETARAIGVYHGQDHDGFQVKLADGTEGLILAGDTFKVTSR
jgi:hypothetical protein